MMKLPRDFWSKRRPTLVWFAIVGVFVGYQLFFSWRNASSGSSSASFSIVSPEAGTTVSSPIQLSVALTDTELGWPNTGQDHLHVSVDGGPPEAIYKNRVLNLSMPPGKHIIGVDLAGPNHRSLLPPKYVTFTVR
jgi:hypothetical protein